MATKTTTYPPPGATHIWRDGKRLTILPDPPQNREPELMHQTDPITRAIYMIRDFKAGRRGNFLVGSGGYLCQSGWSYSDLYVPDVIFAELDDPDTVVNIQNGYVIDEVGKPPDLVLEIASPSTGRRDYTIKREGYARLGVVEYWRFDPSGGDWHDAPLAGDLLVDGAYEPIELHREPDGSIWGRSAALGLDIYWQDKELRFYDYERGEFLPDYTEVREQRDRAEAHAEAEAIRADAETARANAEAQARAEAEAELERLRERMGGVSPPS